MEVEVLVRKIVTWPRTTAKGADLADGCVRGWGWRNALPRGEGIGLVTPRGSQVSVQVPPSPAPRRQLLTILVFVPETTPGQIRRPRSRRRDACYKTTYRGELRGR
jgi:hypothetical protein